MTPNLTVNRTRRFMPCTSASVSAARRLPCTLGGSEVWRDFRRTKDSAGYDTTATIRSSSTSIRSEVQKSKVYLPVDIPAFARSIGADPELIFGRLHFHLEPLHSRNDGNVTVPFFQSYARTGTQHDERHVVNFPLLESRPCRIGVSAQKFRLPVLVSAISATVAELALLILLLATARNMRSPLSMRSDVPPNPAFNRRYASSFSCAALAARLLT